MLEVLKLYNNILLNHPLKTEMFTSASLWFLGDILAQELEHSDQKAAVKSGVVSSEKGLDQTTKTCSRILKDAPRIDLKRTCIQTFYAGAIWGVMGHYWYQFLDKQALKYTIEGTTRFVAVKLGLEIVLLHPIALFSFFVGVGLLGGESLAEIGKQLRKDYWQTLVIEWCLWTPLDIANFKYVPLQHQLLVVNTACLLESIMLSHIKSNGLFSGATNKANLQDQANQTTEKKKKE